MRREADMAAILMLQSRYGGRKHHMSSAAGVAPTSICSQRESTRRNLRWLYALQSLGSVFDSAPIAHYTYINIKPIRIGTRDLFTQITSYQPARSYWNRTQRARISLEHPPQARRRSTLPSRLKVHIAYSSHGFTALKFLSASFITFFHISTFYDIF